VKPVLLDGAVGTLLEARGLRLPPPLWATGAVMSHPERLTALHRSYARAGATVHTAATFRASSSAAGPAAADLAARAIAIVRGAIPTGQRVAASLAPVEDCWHPERSPPDAHAQHARTARLLADAGPDLLLVETFAHSGEAVAATAAAAATGLPVWTSLTPGWDGRLLSPAALADAARAVVDAGAEVVCVNCLPAARASAWVEALAAVGAPWGVYANAGEPADGLGYGQRGAAARYAALAASWLDMGAVVVGGCCGTGPAHVAALAGHAAFCSNRSESS
jgi:S-methylmethionine-dependent homocysteine/selenocysteine methylase